jgi:single-strand DNA-binding protein
MAGVNKVILVGNLGKDPEVRALETGVKVCRFPIATSESYTDKGGQRVDQTEWHNIVLWRGLAEISEKYLKKGNQVYIEGKLQTRSYEKDGITRYSTEIVANQMTMLGSKGDNSGAPSEAPSAPASQPASSPAADTSVDETDDLPF